jgi:hypothetical protein
VNHGHNNSHPGCGGIDRDTREGREMKNTPWGVSQHEEELAPGIVSHGTAGHGGIHLDLKRRQAIRWEKNWLGTSEWWEEDCDWSIPYYFFRDDIRKHGKAYKFEQNLEAAIKTIKGYAPEFAKREGLI